MTFVGSVIKTAINTMDKLSIDATTAKEKQLEQLNELLIKAKDTSFGKYYNFAGVLSSENLIQQFKKNVPIFEYEKMNERWWVQQQIYPDITWLGSPNYFARSSGTTGKTSKRIPVTDEYIERVRSVGLDMIKSLANFDLPPSLYETEILMISSSAKLSENKKGFQEGEISGINVSNFPDWYDVFYRPGQEIAAIDSWDDRVELIVKKAPDWDIGFIAGIPSWVLELLKEIVSKHKLNNIHEIWPNFNVYSSGGVSFDTYRKAFEKICGKPITIMDTYLASEGFFAFTARPGTMSMQLALEHGIFYEFIPFNQDGFDKEGNLLDQPKTLTIDEVELDTEYALIVSTCAGAWRYFIGDTIKFTNLDYYELVLTGRTKFFLNVVGSQLSEEKLDKAILEVAKKHHSEVTEYVVGAMKRNDSYIHQWIIITDDQIDTKKWEKDIDEQLKSANKNYEVARTKALHGVQVKVITKATYHDYLSLEKKKGGQVKTPKVMPEKKLEEFLEFVS